MLAPSTLVLVETTVVVLTAYCDYLSYSLSSCRAFTIFLRLTVKACCYLIVTMIAEIGVEQRSCLYGYPVSRSWHQAWALDYKAFSSKLAIDEF